MVYLLHISDLHTDENANWHNMSTAITNHVRAKLNEKKDADKALLVITGDFHYFEESQFDKTKEFLKELVQCMGIEWGQDVFIVPGNHDISPDTPQDSDREDRIKAILDDPTKLYKGDRLKKLLSDYGAYCRFVHKLGIYKHKPDYFLPARVHVRNWNGKLNILHLNTTLIADGKNKTNQMLDATTATSSKVKKQLCDFNAPCIAMGHNNFFDLHPMQQEQMLGLFLQANIPVYLCGDRHKMAENLQEQEIHLGNKKHTYNIACYRTSSDEKDDYSDFGIIWHIWDEDTGNVEVEYWKWNPKNQGELKPDHDGGITQYLMLRNDNSESPEKNSSGHFNDNDKERSGNEVSGKKRKKKYAGLS